MLLCNRTEDRLTSFPSCRSFRLKRYEKGQSIFLKKISTKLGTSFEFFGFGESKSFIRKVFYLFIKVLLSSRTWWRSCRIHVSFSLLFAHFMLAVSWKSCVSLKVRTHRKEDFATDVQWSERGQSFGSSLSCRAS